MYNEERISKLKEDKYQEIFGVKKSAFDKMLEIKNILEVGVHQN